MLEIDNVYDLYLILNIVFTVTVLLFTINCLCKAVHEYALFHEFLAFKHVHERENNDSFA